MEPPPTKKVNLTMCLAIRPNTLLRAPEPPKVPPPVEVPIFGFVWMDGLCDWRWVQYVGWILVGCWFDVE